MIFWIKILLYSNSTSNLIIFFQNPIHSKQKNEEVSVWGLLFKDENRGFGKDSVAGS